MSSSPLDLPILISQLHYVAKIAHAEKAGPEVQKQLFGPLINEHIRQNEEKVQQVDKKQKTTPVDRDGHQDQGQQTLSDKKERKKEPEEDDSPDSGSSDRSPWSGNIVNVKI